MSKFGCRKRKGVRLLIRLVEIPIGLGNQRIFSRLPSFGKWAETPEKINEVVTKKNSAKATISLSHWMNDFQNSFVPPPPRPPYIEDQELVTDGLTTCDVCGWAWSEKNFYSIEGHQAENSNDFIWVFWLLVVSFSSAFFGALVALKYRRSNSIRAFGPRNGGKTPELCSEQKHQQEEMRNTSNVDLKFFMEDSQNDEAFYATLDDQDSINSENMTTYPKSNTKSDENDMPMFSSAPSSAYYSDLSNPPEKQYECIDNFATFDKSDYSRSSGIGSTFITLNNNNRLSAISENKTVNSDYV